MSITHCSIPRDALQFIVTRKNTLAFKYALTSGIIKHSDLEYILKCMCERMQIPDITFLLENHSNYEYIRSATGDVYQLFLWAVDEDDYTFIELLLRHGAQHYLLLSMVPVQYLSDRLDNIYIEKRYRPSKKYTLY